MIVSKPRRPVSVSLLAWMVFIVTILNLLRLGLTLYNWDFMADLLSPASAAPLFPAYLAVSGFVWGAVGLLLIWGTWRGKHWAPYFLLAAMLAYSIYYWADRLFIPGYPLRNADWPFAISLNLLILFWSLWVMTRRKAREYFGEAHERQNRQTE